MAIASVGAIWAIVLAATIAMVVLLRTGISWLWPAPAAAALCLLVLSRAIPLAVMRRQEYEADRVAATLVGGPDAVIAFLNWVSSHGGDKRSKPWYATHPSNAARRQALVGAQSSRL